MPVGVLRQPRGRCRDQVGHQSDSVADPRMSVRTTLVSPLPEVELSRLAGASPRADHPGTRVVVTFGRAAYGSRVVVGCAARSWLDRRQNSCCRDFRACCVRESCCRGLCGQILARPRPELVLSRLSGPRRTTRQYGQLVRCGLGTYVSRCGGRCTARRRANAHCGSRRVAAFPVDDLGDVGRGAGITGVRTAE